MSFAGLSRFSPAAEAPAKPLVPKVFQCIEGLFSPQAKHLRNQSSDESPATANKRRKSSDESQATVNTNNTVKLVAEDVQVSFVVHNGEKPRRSMFKPSCIRIVEDNQDLLRSYLIVDTGKENQPHKIHLFGTHATCGHVSQRAEDAQPTFAANCIFIRLSDASVGWIFALPSKDAMINLADRLRFAGCIMGDLQDHVTFTSAYESGIRLGRPNTSRMATKADVVALKTARSKTKSAEAQLLNEVQFLLKLKHPGILRAYGIYDVKPAGGACLGILVEFMKGQDLSRWIPEGGLPEEMLRVMMTDVCNVLAYLHGMLIIHRDVKPSNVLCERADDGSVKVILADFGLGAHVADVGAISKRCGTPGYTAPEMLQKGWGRGFIGYSNALTKIDMFSFGAMIYTAAVGRNPFAGSSPELTLRQNKRGLLPFESVEFRSLSDDLQDLLRNVCAIAPSERFSSSEASCNAWLSSDPDKSGFHSTDIQMCNEKISWNAFKEAAEMQT
jgi:hypothetical protein